MKACRCSIALIRHDVKEEDHAFADVEKESDGTRTPEIALANTLAKYEIFGDSLLDMQITASSFLVLCHATHSLAAEYLAAEETDTRIRQLFPSRWAFPTVCLFHQYVKEFRQSNQLQRAGVHELHVGHNSQPVAIILWAVRYAIFK